MWMERNVVMRTRIFERKKGDCSNRIAKERLKLMVESVPMENSPTASRRMKKEIADIISRYFDISPENYEIRVILKQNRKRA